MKKWIMGIILEASLTTLAGTVSPPKDRIAFPQVYGSYLVCVWDETANGWYTGDFIEYDNSGSYALTVPEWNQWYWVGLWDVAAGRYVYGTWIGHVKTD